MGEIEDSIACKVLSFHKKRKMKAPLKNKIWGVYNKQVLWLSFAVEIFGFSLTNERLDWIVKKCRPLVGDIEILASAILCWIFCHLQVVWLFMLFKIFRMQVLKKSG